MIVTWLKVKKKDNLWYKTPMFQNVFKNVFQIFQLDHVSISLDKNQQCCKIKHGHDKQIQNKLTPKLND